MAARICLCNTGAFSTTMSVHVIVPMCVTLPHLWYYFYEGMPVVSESSFASNITIGFTKFLFDGKCVSCAYRLVHSLACQMVPSLTIIQAFKGPASTHSCRIQSGGWRQTISHLFLLPPVCSFATEAPKRNTATVAKEQKKIPVYAQCQRM